ncbi:MAG: HTH domain-containing protein [Candidatus Aenigmarchaeota archaeon]|nr:HTH domain-containing protein [Candidatus Aenigmarchaeota archaeon]
MSKQLKKDPRKVIMEILKMHPEGLTIQKIAKLSGMSRLTATKYIHELLGAGVIYQRKVGVAKLCYLKERYVQEVKQEEILEKLRKKLLAKKKVEQK